ncbi:MAG: hypothetical protein AAF645_19345 [Myxococcota bacterium]
MSATARERMEQLLQGRAREALSDRLQSDPWWRALVVQAQLVLEPAERASWLGTARFDAAAELARCSAAPVEVRDWIHLGLARLAMLGSDVAMHVRIVASAEELGGRAVADLLRAWHALLLGDVPDALDRQLAGDSPALRIEYAVVEAERQLLCGELEEATRVARRASRMARTEALPQWNYLAGLTLARVRRRRGESHRAARITEALLRVCPKVWSQPLLFELEVCSGQWPLPDPIEASADSVRALYRAAQEGNHARFRGIADGLTERLGDHRQRADVLLLLECLDPRTPIESLSAEGRGFVLGECTDAPHALHCAASGPALRGRAPSVIWVLASTDGTARRVIEGGIGLVDAERVEREGKHGRTERLIAELALAGGPVPQPELFRRIYGFDYEAAPHEGLWRVLLHRARKLLSGTGAIERTGNALCLVVRTPFAVPDPRTTIPVSDQILRRLSTHPWASARTLAGHLALPLRTVQEALRQLVSEGACASVRRGSHVQYRVEDTTFQEATDLSVAAEQDSP